MPDLVHRPRARRGFDGARIDGFHQSGEFVAGDNTWVTIAQGTSEQEPAVFVRSDQWGLEYRLATSSRSGWRLTVSRPP